MNESIKITAEISKTDVSALFFLLGEELTEQQWKELSESPISVDWNKLDKDGRRNLKMVLISMAALSLKSHD